MFKFKFIHSTCNHIYKTTIKQKSLHTMRNRALSDEGFKLYLHGTQPPRRRFWARRLVCGLFHTEYDNRLCDVVCQCRQSSQALAAQFQCPNIRERLDAGILHTIRLILTRDAKKVKKRHVIRSFRFFVDVMEKAHQYHDHQTAHMLYLALTHPAIANLHLKMRRKDAELLQRVGDTYGRPSYHKHIAFWRSVREQHALPSLIAFHTYITRRDFMGKRYEADEARDMMDIYQYLEHNPDEILPLYSQKRLTNKQVIEFSKKLNF